MAVLFARVTTGRQLAQVEKPLLHFLQMAQKSKFVFRTIYIELLLVHLLQQQGLLSRARSTLRKVLKDVEETGYVRLVMMHRALLPLLRAERSSYAQQLVVRMEQQPALLTYQFTKQERRVFDHVVEGYSIQEIAQEMVVSQATVKWHLGNLYAKLGV